MTSIKNVANIISITRMAAAMGMVLVMPFSPAFYCLYSYGGITDVADGFFARKTHTQSRTGAALDSAADMLFCGAAAFKLLPVLWGLLPRWSLYACLLIAGIRIFAYIVGALKFHRFVSLHTLLNKAAGGSLFFAVYLIKAVSMDGMAAVLCAIAGMAAIEEMLLVFAMKEYEPDVKGRNLNRKFRPPR